MRPHLELTDDAVLLAYAATSDETYFAELYERYWTPLVKYFNKTWPGSQAEDLAQETFLRVMKYAPSYKGGSVNSWVFTIAIRRNYSTPSETAEELCESLEAASREVDSDNKDEVEVLLSYAPRRQSEALRSYYIDGEHSLESNRLRGLRRIRETLEGRATKLEGTQV